MPAPGIYDPTDHPGESDERWFPANEVTALLVASLEACKDIHRLSDTLQQQHPSHDQRGMTLLCTPVVSLADNVTELHRKLGLEDRSSWSPQDIENFRQHAKKLRKHRETAVRQIRSTRAAHHDPQALGQGRAPNTTPEMVLEPLEDALFVLTLAMNHDRVFVWTRYPDPAKRNEIELFLELATKALVDDDGHLRKILAFTVTKDPRHDAFAVIAKTMGVFNWLIEDAGYPSRRIAFRFTESDPADPSPIPPRSSTGPWPVTSG